MRLLNFGKIKTVIENLPDTNEDNNLLRVLFIEDNPDDLELNVYNLNESGYKLEYDCVDMESDFIDCIEANTYDIIIADFQLPGWTGLDAYKILKEMGNDTPLLLVTGAVGDDRAIDCLKQGVTDYILKDNLAKLSQEVSRILNIKKTKHDQKHTDTQSNQVEAQLIEKNEELNKFQDLSTERELKMVELKKEVNALLVELGREPRYKVIE